MVLNADFLFYLLPRHSAFLVRHSTFAFSKICWRFTLANLFPGEAAGKGIPSTAKNASRPGSAFDTHPLIIEVWCICLTPIQGHSNT
jgi:hypothetical protein